MAETSRIPRSTLFWRPVAGLLLLLALSACSDSRLAPPESGTRDPVLLLAIDGLEWDVIFPLIRQQELPTLTRLMERGSFGLLETSRPTFSPIIWTTVATGKTPQEHGIRGFVRKSRNTGEERRLYNSHDRRTKAFWNILSDFDRRVAVVGWWLSYPAEEVNGVMVAQVNTLSQAHRRRGENIIKGSLQRDLEDQVYPPERFEEFLQLHLAVDRGLPKRTEEIFGAVPRPLTPLTRTLWDNTQWALRADASYAEIAQVLAQERFDLLAVYLGGADVVGHRFWRHYRPDQFDHPPSAEELAAFGTLIPDYYRYLDRVLAALLERLPADTNILIVSDHGMHPVNTDEEFPPDGQSASINTGHHRGAWPGVLIAAGPGVRQQAGPDGLDGIDRSQLPSWGSIFDLSPTLLTLLEIPVGADMRGTALSDILAEPVGQQIRQIPSHDSAEWLASRAQASTEVVPPDEERLEQLRALGYIN